MSETGREQHAAEGYGLSLCCGGFDGSQDTTAAVGHEVVAALAAAGLPTRWDGSPGQAISVTPLDWRKRLVERRTRPPAPAEAASTQ